MVLVGGNCCSSSVFDILFLWRHSSIELKNELIFNLQKLKETFLQVQGEANCPALYLS